MADLERHVSTAPAGHDIESLPSLFGRLGDDVMRLLDTKLSLVKVEIKEDAARYTKAVVVIAAGGSLAVTGLALLNVALALLISTLFSFTPQQLNYALGFLITGGLYAIIGTVIALVMKGKLALMNPAPARTLEEFRKDKQWLKNEI